tara:strand:+ start:975 stop:1232 length:258 start_codon:yes stop_codon:yes gene_type:complete
MTTGEIEGLGYKYDSRVGGYVSTKRQLGASTGDDRNLVIDCEEGFADCLIYWLDRRADRHVVFEGFVTEVSGLEDLLNKFIQPWG